MIYKVHYQIRNIYHNIINTCNLDIPIPISTKQITTVYLDKNCGVCLTVFFLPVFRKRSTPQNNIE